MKRRTLLGGLLFLPVLAHRTSAPHAFGGTVTFNCDIAESGLIAFYLGGAGRFDYQWTYLENGRIVRQPFFGETFDSGEMLLWFGNGGYQILINFVWTATVPAWLTFATCV